MDPKPSAHGILLAPPPDGSSAALHMPGRESFPRVDNHLVEPETTRDEVIRGRRAVAMPALPPHADRQFDLAYILGARVKPGFIGSAELLTRVGVGSDFATDVCVRRRGTDPATGERYLEELAFEVVNEQSERDITEKAEELTRRGVRRVVAIFVRKAEVSEWTSGRWQRLDLDAMFSDETLSAPVHVRELIDAAGADDAVARALLAKGNQTLLSPLREGVRSLCRVLALELSPSQKVDLERMGAAEIDALRARIERDRRWD